MDFVLFLDIVLAGELDCCGEARERVQTANQLKLARERSEGALD